MKKQNQPTLQIPEMLVQLKLIVKETPDKFIIPSFLISPMPTEIESFWQDLILSRNFIVFPVIAFEYSFISDEQFQMMIFSLLLNYHWNKVFIWDNGVVIHKPRIYVRIENPGFDIICLSVLFSKIMKNRKKLENEILLSIQSIGLKCSKTSITCYHCFRSNELTFPNSKFPSIPDICTYCQTPNSF